MRSEESRLHPLDATRGSIVRALRDAAGAAGESVDPSIRSCGAALLRHQARRTRDLAPVIATVLAAAGVVLGGVLLAVAVAPLEVPDLTQDPIAVLERRAYAPYIGILSNLGILLWSATATLCLFTAMGIEAKAEGPRRAFFLAAGGLTLLWLLDDLLMIHEATDQGFVYAVYTLAAGLFLLRHIREILAGETILLALALAGFALSVGIDGNLVPTPEAAHYFLEDGLKFTGLCFWFAFFGRACRKAVFGERPAGPAGRP